MNIEETGFGWIKIDGKRYDHDLVIYPNAMEERKKWITKEKHGTSHKFTREEMEEYLGKVDPSEIEVVVIGTGQYCRLGLLDEAEKLLEKNEIEAVELKTPKAMERFEEREEPHSRKLGIFHVTC